MFKTAKARAVAALFSLVAIIGLTGQTFEDPSVAPRSTSRWEVTPFREMMWEDTFIVRDSNGDIQSIYVNEDSGIDVVQDAIDSLDVYGGGDLYLSPGLFLINSVGQELDLANNVRIHGAGKEHTEIRFTNGYSGSFKGIFMIEADSNVVIEDIDINVGFDSYADSVSGHIQQYGVAFWGGGSKNVEIKNCIIRNAHICIRVHPNFNHNGNKINNNLIKPQSIDDAGVMYAIHAPAVGSGSNNGWVIEENEITNYYEGWEHLSNSGYAAVSWGGNFAQIRNNHIHDWAAGGGPGIDYTTPGTEIAPGGIGIYILAGSKGNIISNNILERVAGDNISIRGPDVVCTDNYIHNSNDQGIVVEGDGVSAVRNVVIAGNVVDSVRTAGIRVLNASGIEITGNSVRNWSMPGIESNYSVGENYEAGISVFNLADGDEIDNVSIANNTLVVDAGTSDGIWGIRVLDNWTNSVDSLYNDTVTNILLGENIVAGVDTLIGAYLGDEALVASLANPIGGVVKLTPAVYLLDFDQSVPYYLLPANTTIRGVPGKTVLKMNDSLDPDDFDSSRGFLVVEPDSDYVVIEGITFEGNTANQSTAAGLWDATSDWTDKHTAILIGNETTSADSVVGTTVRNCVFNDMVRGVHVNSNQDQRGHEIVDNVFVPQTTLAGGGVDPNTAAIVMNMQGGKNARGINFSRNRVYDDGIGNMASAGNDRHPFQIPSVTLAGGTNDVEASSILDNMVIVRATTAAARVDTTFSDWTFSSDLSNNTSEIISFTFDPHDQAVSEARFVAGRWTSLENSFCWDMSAETDHGGSANDGNQYQMWLLTQELTDDEIILEINGEQIDSTGFASTPEDTISIPAATPAGTLFRSSKWWTGRADFLKLSGTAKNVNWGRTSGWKNFGRNFVLKGIEVHWYAEDTTTNSPDIELIHYHDGLAITPDCAAHPVLPSSAILASRFDDHDFGGDNDISIVDTPYLWRHQDINTFIDVVDGDMIFFRVTPDPLNGNEFPMTSMTIQLEIQRL